LKVLVIGSGGREHALAWKLAQSPRVQNVIVAPGNAGSATEPNCENALANSVEQWLALAKNEKVGMTVVGPEAPLAAEPKTPPETHTPGPQRSGLLPPEGPRPPDAKPVSAGPRVEGPSTMPRPPLPTKPKA